MKLSEYKIHHPEPKIHSTLCFLLREDSVLLAMKKRGFGTGRFNGIGGKKTESETIEETAKRETKEEIDVTIKSLEPMATLNFLYSHKPEWDQKVFVYIVRNWEGEPEESEEMAPRWFKIADLPFLKMWPDDPYWLPLVLRRKKIWGEFLFGENDTILDFILTSQAPFSEVR